MFPSLLRRSVACLAFAIFLCVQHANASIVVIDDFQNVLGAGNTTGTVTPSGATITIPNPIMGGRIDPLQGTAGGGCYRIAAIVGENGASVTMRYDLTSAITCTTLDLPVFGNDFNFSLANWDVNISTTAGGAPIYSGALQTSITDNAFGGATTLEFEFLYKGTVAQQDANVLFFGKGDGSTGKDGATGGGDFGVSGDAAVPEPGSAAFLGMVLAATGFVRRRRS